MNKMQGYGKLYYQSGIFILMKEKLHTMEIGTKINLLAQEFSTIRILILSIHPTNTTTSIALKNSGQSTKASSKRIVKTEREFSTYQMVKIFKVTSSTILPKGKVFLPLRLGRK